MKSLFCMILSCLVSPSTADITAQTYGEGDTLVVVALSGLRLRTSPHTDAGTIRILEYGDKVRVTGTHDFDQDHAGKAGWLDGHWIRVEAGRTEGYVFDAFVSTLDIPVREDELCYESLRFSAPLQTYLSNHYPVLADENGMEYREDIDQCKTYHMSNIEMTVTQGNGWYKTDLTLDGYRLAEVVNLLRSMIVGQDLLQSFEDSLMFYTDAAGVVRRIRGGTAEEPVTIYRKGNMIEVSITELIAG